MIILVTDVLNYCPRLRAHDVYAQLQLLRVFSRSQVISKEISIALKNSYNECPMPPIFCRDKIGSLRCVAARRVHRDSSAPGQKVLRYLRRSRVNPQLIWVGGVRQPLASCR